MLTYRDKFETSVLPGLLNNVLATVSHVHEFRLVGSEISCADY